MQLLSSPVIVTVMNDAVVMIVVMNVLLTVLMLLFNVDAALFVIACAMCVIRPVLNAPAASISLAIVVSRAVIQCQVVSRGVLR